MEREKIKANILSRLLTSRALVRKQMIEIVSTISQLDSPINEWDELLNFLSTNLKSDDIQNVNTALEVANRLFKGYRSKTRSWSLFEEVTFVADRLTEPLTDKVISIMFLLNTQKHDDDTLRIIYKAAILVVKVFHSLSTRNLPQYFCTHLNAWMDAFHEMMCIEERTNVCLK